MVEFETLVKDLLNFVSLLLVAGLLIRLHLELDVEVAVRAVGDNDRVGLVESNGDRAEIKELRRNADRTVIARANNLNLLLDLHVAFLRSSLVHVEARARVEEADFVLGEVKQVLCNQRGRNLVILLFQGSKRAENLLHLIGHQNRLDRLQAHFVGVLLRHIPFKLQRNAGFVLDVEALVLRNSRVDWREKQFFLRECKLRSVGATLEVDGLQIGRGVVEHNLRGKVEEARSLW